MHIRKLFLTASLAGLMTMPAMATNITAQDFVTKASIANQFEIDSSELALEKSQSSEVKSFAQQMIDDHTKTGEKLKSVLQSSDSHAQPAADLDDKHKKLLSKLQNTPQTKFDDKYISIQTDAHKEAVDLFSDYSKNGEDASLKDFATETLPTLEKHLKHVEGLKSNH